MHLVWQSTTLIWLFSPILVRPKGGITKLYLCKDMAESQLGQAGTQQQQHQKKHKKVKQEEQRENTASNFQLQYKKLQGIYRNPDD